MSVPPGARSELARKRSAATMLLTDPLGRVLIVRPTYKPSWELPGGATESGESPAGTAVREVAEELGLTRPVGDLLALDYVPAAGTRTEGLIVVFDGGTLTDEADALQLPADELSDARFVAPEDLGEYLPPLQTRRALAALEARRAGRTVYLEDGAPPSG